MSEIKTRPDAAGQPIKVGDFVASGKRGGSSEVTVGLVVGFNKGKGFEVFQGWDFIVGKVHYGGGVHHGRVITRQTFQVIKADLTCEVKAALEAAWEEYTSLHPERRSTHK